MSEIDLIVQKLAAGNTILYPTDTIWGLGCDATNAAAVERIYEIKNRPKDKPFILLVDGIDMLHEYVDNIHPRLETLLFYHERPLTVIYDTPKNLPDIAMGPDKTVGIRVTQDLFCKTIIEQLGKPIVATSANKSDRPFPRNFGSIDIEVIKESDYVVKYKQDDQSESAESVIVKVSDKAELVFLRT